MVPKSPLTSRMTRVYHSDGLDLPRWCGGAFYDAKSLSDGQLHPWRRSQVQGRAEENVELRMKNSES